ncbi:hypothetical protein Sa4125_04270 [Aureimonas sp. SA4125]|uniref:hypothetical protein n=1 Tax=Aureimonas sp. SA4125 TaxID=2826993 RepID=UPI001CC42F23|nr:hypothetical protein [Aureimonas sp. SA4125]BDA82885.1 hypothetical protein Sa4125_04270 [Aureimonas sp. SA4125]
MPSPVSPTRRGFRSSVSSFLRIVGGAQECAQAAGSGRTPSREALRAVGIDAGAWNSIGKL